ncbi:hypothetical protein [Kingella oralis]|uniref:hypothetical protein n=1 Tax=Kingella oralis TaxID=505 RepID=UPI0034E61413
MATEPVARPVPQSLMLAPERPAPPENGQPETLLRHAVAFGEYVKRLETQLAGWRAWAQEDKP